jgi:hypothetical protein
MVSIASQSGPDVKAGTDTGWLASASSRNIIADTNIGGTGASATKDMVSLAGVEFDPKWEKRKARANHPGLVYVAAIGKQSGEALARLALLRDDLSNSIPKLASLSGDLVIEFVQHLLPRCGVFHQVSFDRKFCRQRSLIAGERNAKTNEPSFWPR